MSAKDAHLYGTRPTHRTKAKPISNTSTLAFSSTLSSLIKASSSSSSTTNTTSPSGSGATTQPPTTGRARPTKKEDIFKSHNKGVHKRSAKDLEDSSVSTQKHRSRTSEEKDQDAETWRRTKRRMEDKARLYDALKRGDIEDRDDKYGVDFDRKWAEARDADDGRHPAVSSSSSDESSNDEPEEVVKYIDEFGRTITGSRAAAARSARLQNQRALAASEPDRFSARPSQPSTLIYGDTVQTHAFNPDAARAEAMASLAAKRDKSLTPPPEEHFDGRAEVRQRGTGFFYFARDGEERRVQMDGLERERRKTEKVREEARERVERRRKEVEERRRKVRERRVVGEADKWLENLGRELNGKTEEDGDGKEEMEGKCEV